MTYNLKLEFTDREEENEYYKNEIFPFFKQCHLENLIRETENPSLIFDLLQYLPVNKDNINVRLLGDYRFVDFFWYPENVIQYVQNGNIYSENDLILILFSYVINKYKRSQEDKKLIKNCVSTIKWDEYIYNSRLGKSYRLWKNNNATKNIDGWIEYLYGIKWTDIIFIELLENDAVAEIINDTIVNYLIENMDKIDKVEYWDKPLLLMKLLYKLYKSANSDEELEKLGLRLCPQLHFNYSDKSLAIYESFLKPIFKNGSDDKFYDFLITLSEYSYVLPLFKYLHFLSTNDFNDFKHFNQYDSNIKNLTKYAKNVGLTGKFAEYKFWKIAFYEYTKCDFLQNIYEFKDMTFYDYWMVYNYYTDEKHIMSCNMIKEIFHGLGRETFSVFSDHEYDGKHFVFCLFISMLLGKSKNDIIFEIFFSDKDTSFLRKICYKIFCSNEIFPVLHDYFLKQTQQGVYNENLVNRYVSALEMYIREMFPDNTLPYMAKDYFNSVSKESFDDEIISIATMICKDLIMLFQKNGDNYDLFEKILKFLIISDIDDKISSEIVKKANDMLFKMKYKTCNDYQEFINIQDLLEVVIFFLIRYNQDLWEIYRPLLNTFMSYSHNNMLDELALDDIEDDISDDKKSYDSKMDYNAGDMAYSLLLSSVRFMSKFRKDELYELSEKIGFYLANKLKPKKNNLDKNNVTNLEYSSDIVRQYYDESLKEPNPYMRLAYIDAIKQLDVNPKTKNGGEIGGILKKTAESDKWDYIRTRASKIARNIKRIKDDMMSSYKRKIIYAIFELAKGLFYSVKRDNVCFDEHKFESIRSNAVRSN